MANDPQIVADGIQGRVFRGIQPHFAGSQAIGNEPLQHIQRPCAFTNDLDLIASKTTINDRTGGISPYSTINENVDKVPELFEDFFWVSGIFFATQRQARGQHRARKPLHKCEWYGMVHDSYPYCLPA
jgi:hypothetical protein